MTFENKKLMQMTVRQRLSPFPNYMSMECISKEMAKVIGINYEFVLIIFKKRMAYVFFDEKDYEKVVAAIFGKELLAALENDGAFYWSGKNDLIPSTKFNFPESNIKFNTSL